MSKEKSKKIIFTDGASRGNPGPGGWAFVLVEENDIREFGGRDEKTTNNRMELQAAIEAVAKTEGDIEIYSDSKYVVDGITKWIHGWKKNDWITSTKTPVNNKDLWERLDSVTSGRKIKWNHLAGHASIPGNERADKIATAFADEVDIRLYSGAIENYPVKNILNLSGVGSRVNASKSGKAYSYLSMVNGVVKHHKTWSDTEARVKGKHGALYRKALDKDHEEAILKEWKERYGV